MQMFCVEKLEQVESMKNKMNIYNISIQRWLILFYTFMYICYAYPKNWDSFHNVFYEQLFPFVLDNEHFLCHTIFF